MDVRVFRPSIVVGAAPPTAGGNPSNLFFGFIRLVVRDAPTQAAMLRTISERLGVRGLALVDAQTEPLADASPFDRSVARMLEPYRAYLTRDLPFDDATTGRLLGRCVVERPTFTTDAVHQLIDRALVTKDARPLAPPAAVR